MNPIELALALVLSHTLIAAIGWGIGVRMTAKLYERE